MAMPALVWFGVSPLPLIFRPAVTCMTAVAIALAPLGGLSASAGNAAASVDYQACQAGDDQAFKQAIEAVTISALTGGLKGVNYEAAVGNEWQRLDIDSIIDKRVDIAVEEVRNETSFGGLVKSLADQQKAQELATAVADRVYKSDAMQSAIAALALGVGTEVGKHIEVATKDASGPALECLKTFLGPRYGSAVAAAVTGTAGQEFGVDAKGGAEVTPGDVLKQSGQGITGAAILLMRRQLANMAQRIGQRVVGSVLARLVSVVAGGVGLVLLAKDIWDLRHGVLPIVSEEMKSKDTKQKVRQELVKSLEEEIGQHVHDIGAKAAGRVLEVWQDFRRAHAKALELADRNLAFKSFLETIKPTALPRLDEITSLVLGGEGEAGILKRLDNGTLGRAINELPEPGMVIARETRSIETALAWSAVAGDELGSVVEHTLHQRTTPDTFSKATLQKVLDLKDPIAIPKLASAGREARDVLFELEPDRLKILARALDGQELSTLASYLTGLQPGPRARILSAVAQTPAIIQVLAPARVRNAIIASADQLAAVEMILRPAGSATQATALDFMAAWQGQISPILLWEKHPMMIGTFFLLFIFVMLWLRRLLSPARRRQVTSHATPPPPQPN